MLYWMFKIKRYKFLSRKYDIIEKNCSNKSCTVQKNLFTDFISLTLDGVAKIRSHRFFKMEHPTFNSESNN